MNLKKCLDNLKYDLSNGGIEDDSFAMICYVTMANEACRIVKNGTSLDEVNDAKEYIALCHNVDSLRCVIEG